MKISKEAQKSIYFNFIRAYELKDGTISKLKFNMFLNKIKKYADKLIAILEKNNTEVSPEKSKDIEEKLGIDEAYRVIMEIYSH